MKKYERQSGITLIALIITMILMLILVAVTISISLNGGLFEKAQTAAEQTQKTADKEQRGPLQAIFLSLYVNLSCITNLSFVR